MYPISHFSCVGYMTASRTKDEPLLHLGTKDRLGQSFDFQSRRSSYKTFDARGNKTIWVARMHACARTCQIEHGTMYDRWRRVREGRKKVQEK